jgi:purine-binding chemotaxis protein CheW
MAILDELQPLAATQGDTDEREMEMLGPEHQFAVVELSGQSLAIETLLCSSIRDVPQITPVPFTSNIVLGVANIRGDIYSVVDVRSLLDLTPAPPDHTDPLIIVIIGSNYSCGMTIEGISEIIRIREGQIVEPLTEIPYVSGIYRRGQDNILIVDVELLLASPEMTEFQ